MVFSSVIFLFAFLPLVLSGYYLLGRKLRNTFLLLASIGFYAWGEPVFVLVMLGSILLNWGMVWFMQTRKKQSSRRLVLIISLACNLIILFVFKYLNFTISSLNSILGRQVINQTNIALPIGISFFTFQAISYVVDVYRGNGSLQKNPFHVALYIAFFPQLIAGPIVRYQTVAEQLASRRETLEGFSSGVTRFLLGLGKKSLLANTIALLADMAFAEAGTPQLSVMHAWLGAIAYAMQIYFDFSGYSDMAIGLGAMFGFHFPENFNYPYISCTITEFWRRWHISLSTWFRDYVYIPLGGSRASKHRTIFNLFIVWLLTGFWHGANWTFLIWGLFYFLLLAMEKLLKIPDKKHWTVLVFCRAFTLLAVLIAWVLFRSDSIMSALQYLKAMFTPCTLSKSDLFLMRQFGPVLLACVICCVPISSQLKKGIRRFFPTSGDEICGWLSFAWLALVGILSIACVVSVTYNPFIYFTF